MEEARVSRKEVRCLPCPLTEEEQRLRGIELANHNAEYADTEAEKKQVTKDYGDKLKRINERIHELKDAVQTRVEVRDIECDVSIDRYLGKVTITRADTGEIVEVRPMTPGEAQGEMDLR